MKHIALLVLADTESYEGLGRIVNAMTAAKEFKQAGYHAQLILDGAATKWPTVLADENHPYHELYLATKDMANGCDYCAHAFQVHEALETQEVRFASEFEGHPSFVKLVEHNDQIISF